MKTQILTSILLFAAVYCNSQDCFWAKKAGGFYNDFSKGIVINKSGNIYITGYFESSFLNFGDTTLYNQSITNNTYTDFFISKYNHSGQLLFVKQYGGRLNEVSNSIAIDSLDNLYITGYFTSDSLILGSNILHNNNSPYPDFFIAKLDSNGNTLWAQNDLAHGYSLGHSIVADNTGNIFVTGEFQSDSMTIGNITLHKVIPTGGSNFFIIKYNPAGIVQWAKRAGGRFSESGKSITADFAGNAYATGSFTSDSVSFDNINYLHNNNTANGDFFIVKYDPDGNALWAQNHSGGNTANANGITSDGNNVYLTGGFTGQSITLGGITINNYDGDGDVFIAKYNSDGIVIWAKSAGGNSDDQGRNLTIDPLGNVYIVGQFKSDSIYFDNIKLYNAGPSYSYTWFYLFIVKYDSQGNAVWARNAHGTFTEQSFIAVKNENNIFITSSYYNAPSIFGNTTLTNSGNNDLFVSYLYEFSAEISSSTNASCNGFNNGSATMSITGGMSPFSFNWSNGNTSATANNLFAGNYSVTISDVNSCVKTSAITITQPPADSARICMVTVDSLSQHNIIFWDKSQFTTVDSFIVYREIFTNNYKPIARLHYSEPGMFVDTISSLYFPNTGNPNAGTYRYKIQVHDTCGGYSTFSPYHNTIYFLNNNGTFYWTQPYSIENSSNPVNSYVLMRDDNSTGNWHAVSSVTGSQQVINDPLYVIYQNTASWRVKTEWNVSCNPTLKNISSYNSSYSNIYTNNITKIKEKDFSNQIFIYPNPTDSKITLTSSLLKIQSFEIYNIIGESVFSGKNNNKETNIIIDISSLKQGVYFLSLKTPESVILKKIIKN